MDGKNNWLAAFEKKKNNNQKHSYDLHNTGKGEPPLTRGFTSPTPNPSDGDTANALATHVVRVSGTACWNSTSPEALPQAKQTPTVNHHLQHDVNKAWSPSKISLT